MAGCNFIKLPIKLCGMQDYFLGRSARKPYTKFFIKRILFVLLSFRLFKKES